MTVTQTEGLTNRQSDSQKGSQADRQREKQWIIKMPNF